MFKWVSGLLDRIFAVIGALLFAQTPMFIQQYLHQLSGHVNELKYQLNSIQKTATLSGKSISQYIQKFIGSNDPDFARQGELMQGMMERANSLSTAFQEISSASIFSKPFIFIRNLDWAIANDTFSHFQFGIPLTVEGVVYAFIGICAGFAVFQGISYCTSNFYQTLKTPQYFSGK